VKEKNGFSVIGASRQQQDRGSLVETEAKTEAGGVETETEAVKILPQGCIEARQCLEAPHHCYADKFKNPFIIEPMRTKVNHVDFCRF